MKNILFRADSSSDIGIGHIMRDLVLAKQYKNDNIIFATQDLDGNINQEIPYFIEILSSNHIKEVAYLIDKHNIDMIIIDNYKIDEVYERQLKEQYPSLALMVLEDRYIKHYCDILLNHNISASAIKYKGLLPSHCDVLCGEKHILIRDEFKQYKNKSKTKKSKKENIFISMGGSDFGNINIKILETLEVFHNINIQIISTLANKNINQLKQYCKNKKNITLHINSKNIAKIIFESDFAIVTPSVIANEIYYMNIDFLAIKTADNQDDMYQYLAKKSLAMSEFNSIKLHQYMEKVLK